MLNREERLFHEYVEGEEKRQLEDEGGACGGLVALLLGFCFPILIGTSFARHKRVRRTREGRVRSRLFSSKVKKKKTYKPIKKCSYWTSRNCSTCGCQGSITKAKELLPRKVLGDFRTPSFFH
jgi:hypothetical protein